MTEGGADPLLLGQRVVAILETGLRTATYKLATLMALVDHCIENIPDDPASPVPVAIPDLAQRVLELYWRQIHPFEGRELRQTTQPRARILIATEEFRAAAWAKRAGQSVSAAALAAPEAFKTAIQEISLCLAQQPLYRLQRLPGTHASDPFLYDDSFLHDDVSRATLRAHGNSIVLLWVEDVRRMNKFLNADVPDIAGHLFGRDRTVLKAVRGPFKDAFGPHCFYCNSHLPADNPIDHVLPWSLVGIDGLANLVLACAKCNGDKRHALPAVGLVDRALMRDRTLLEEVAAGIRWPTQHDRVVAAARGIYKSQPEGIPTWSGYKRSVKLDLAYIPEWTGPS